MFQCTTLGLTQSQSEQQSQSSHRPKPAPAPRPAARARTNTTEQEVVEVVKSEPSQNVAYPAEVYEGGEEVEGQLAQYDETYAGEYEEPQYSEQYGMMDQDNSQQGELQHPTQESPTFWSTQALSLARMDSNGCLYCKCFRRRQNSLL